MALLTPLSLAEARSGAVAFGLDVEAVEPLALGSVNSNFRLVDSEGRRYFARIYEEQALSGAISEVRLLTALHTGGVPVVRPLHTQAGSGVVEVRNKPFAVFPWVEGEWLCLHRVTEARCHALGEALARVHLQSAAVERLSGGRFRPEDMLGRLSEVEGRANAPLRAHVAHIRAKYSEYLPRRDSLPTGICHGDLFRDNVLWQGERLAALLDFESASWGTFVYDLMVTTLAWCYTDVLLLPHVRALFAGYTSLRPLSAAERSALEVEGALACLRFATTRITDFELRAPEGERPARDFRRFLERLSSIERGVLENVRQGLV